MVLDVAPTPVVKATFEISKRSVELLGDWALSHTIPEKQSVELMKAVKDITGMVTLWEQYSVEDIRAKLRLYRSDHWGGPDLLADFDELLKKYEGEEQGAT